MGLLLAPLLALSFTALHLSSQDPAPSPRPQDAAAADVWHAPDLFESDADGLTAPVLIQDAKPNYTGAAMKARIQGIVQLDCIVELDGRISAVRIRRSLDPVNGLDDEAVRTVQRWRFRPAQKDGVAVRSRIGVEISFTLRTNLQPKLEWPPDIRPAKGEPDGRSDKFSKKTLAAANLNIQLNYPTDWSVDKTASSKQLITVDKIVNGEARGCTVLSLSPVVTDLIVPLSQAMLDAYARSLREELKTTGSPTELVRVGQVVAGHVWVWGEMVRRGIDDSTLPSEHAVEMRAAFDGMRIWKFVTTDSGQQLTVICYVFTPRGATSDESTRVVRVAGEDFSAIVSGIRIRDR